MIKRLLDRLRDLDWRGLAQKLPRIIGPVAFGLVIYLITLILVFPYQRAGEYAEAVMAGMGYKVKIGEVGPTFGIGVRVADVEIATNPRDGRSKPIEMVIDKARITTNPIANLMGGLSYDVSAEAFGGEIDVDIAATAARGEGHVRMQQVALARLPGLREKLGLPVKGWLNLDVALELDELKVTKSSGEITLSCEGCELGDGKAKLKVESNPMLREGIVIPRLALGTLKGSIVIEDGVGRIVDLKTTSDDVQLVVEGEVRLADPPNASVLDAYVRFKLSDRLVKTQDALQLLLQFAEAGKRDDGFYGFRLVGPLRSLREPQWSKEAPPPPAAARGKPRPGMPKSGSK